MLYDFFLPVLPTSTLPSHTWHFSHELSPEEERSAQSMVEQGRHCMGLIDDKTTQLQSILEQFRVARSQLSDIITRHEALSAPIRKLHPDVLGEIFIVCAHTGTWPPSSLHDELVPLRLSHVCQLWRFAALRTQEMWTRIELRDNNYYGCLPKSNSKFVGSRLQLSGQQNLDVCMRSWPWSMPDCRDLVVHSHRWGTCELRMETPGSPGGICHSLPRLHTLSIWIDYVASGTWSEPLAPFQTAPELRTIKLSLVSGNVHRLSCAHGWPSLTTFHLSVDTTSLQCMLDLLTAAPRLTELQLTLLLGWTSNTDDPDPGILEHDVLRSLILDSGTSERVLRLLSFLSLPNLASLAVIRGGVANADVSTFLHQHHNIQKLEGASFHELYLLLSTYDPNVRSLPLLLTEFCAHTSNSAHGSLNMPLLRTVLEGDGFREFASMKRLEFNIATEGESVTSTSRSQLDLWKAIAAFLPSGSRRSSSLSSLETISVNYVLSRPPTTEMDEFCSFLRGLGYKVHRRLRRDK